MVVLFDDKFVGVFAHRNVVDKDTEIKSKQNKRSTEDLCDSQTSLLIDLACGDLY